MDIPESPYKQILKKILDENERWGDIKLDAENKAMILTYCDSVDEDPKQSMSASFEPIFLQMESGLGQLISFDMDEPLQSFTRKDTVKKIIDVLRKGVAEYDREQTEGFFKERKIN